MQATLSPSDAVPDWLVGWLAGRLAGFPPIQSYTTTVAPGVPRTVTDKHTSCPCPHAQLDGTGGDNGALTAFADEMANKLQV